MTTKNTGNSLNSMILANIQKEKRKFYNEIKKLLNKYGFQDETAPADRLLTLEAENKKLRHEIQELQKTCDEQKQKIQDQKYKIVALEQKTNATFATNAKPQSVDYVKLSGLLGSVGKGTFKACYDVVANNYNRDREVIKHAIAKYGFDTTGKPYSDDSIQTKTSGSCRIFELGWEKEALRLCEDIRR